MTRRSRHRSPTSSPISSDGLGSPSTSLGTFGGTRQAFRGPLAVGPSALGTTRATSLIARFGYVPAIFLATLCAYWPSLNAGFIWDDDGYVTKPALRSLAGLGRIWLNVGATEQYYPVLHSAFWFEYHLWGETAWCYHLFNVLLHASAACLLVAFLRRALGLPWATYAWAAGLLFALHPVGVESVAWISEEKNTLSTVFYLLAALAYWRWRDLSGGARCPQRAGHSGPSGPNVVGHSELAAVGPARTSYALATACFALAILSKSVAATLPAALLVLLWWQQGRLFWRRDILPLLPWFALAAAGGLFTGWVERTYIGAHGADFELSLPQRFLIAGRAVWFYLAKLLWPAHLVFIYSRWTVDPASLGQWVYPLFTFAVLAALWRIRTWSRAPLAIALLYVGSLFPTLGFLNIYAFLYSFVTDHWQYLGCLVMMSAAAAALGFWVRDRHRLASHLAIAVFAVGLGALSFRQCLGYQNIVVFYKTIIAANPACWMAYNNLGSYWKSQGRLQEALADFLSAEKLRGNDHQLEQNLASTYHQLGQPQLAIEHFQTALRAQPHEAVTENDLAVELAVAGDPAEALRYVEEAAHDDPDYAEAQYNWANLLRDAGRDAESVAHYEAALRIRPDYFAAEFNCGQVLQRSGQLALAANHYVAALRLQPNSPEAENNLGLALAGLGQAEAATEHYRRAVQFKPDYAEAHYNWGLALHALGQVQAGVDQLAEAVRLKPDYADAWEAEGICLAELGQARQAASCYLTALKLRPNDAGTLGNLAGTLMTLGRTADAVTCFERSLALDPSSASNHYNYGVALGLLGRKTEAEAQLRAALRLRPDFPEATQKLTELQR